GLGPPAAEVDVLDHEVGRREQRDVGPRLEHRAVVADAHADAASAAPGHRQCPDGADERILAVHAPTPAGAAPSRKLASSRLPSSVRMDSGWNCTPSIWWWRWRRPMTSPSSDRAVIWRASGTVSATTTSEW